MNSETIVNSIDNLELGVLDNLEIINENLLSLYTGLFEELVKSGNLPALSDLISSITKLKVNDATKCALLYVASVFVSEAINI